MSAADHTTTEPVPLPLPDNRHVHGNANSHEQPHGSFKGYLTGFLLSVVLTAIPFWLVMGDALPSKSVTVLIVMGLAFVQIFVHMFYFLHMNTRSESGWNMLALIFTGVLVIITLSGSLWVMYHMNANMMPASMQEMRVAP